jgi:hypothetical protein
MDGTFNQDAVCERVRVFTTLDGAVVNSYVLTAATDRLSLWVQQDILGFLMGNAIATHWSTLLTVRNYFQRDTNQCYTYAAGQPMGPKSSWALLAPTHHVSVQKAAKPTHSRAAYTDYA